MHDCFIQPEVNFDGEDFYLNESKKFLLILCISGTLSTGPEKTIFNKTYVTPSTHGGRVEAKTIEAFAAQRMQWSPSPVATVDCPTAALLEVLILRLAEVRTHSPPPPVGLSASLTRSPRPPSQLLAVKKVCSESKVKGPSMNSIRKKHEEYMSAIEKYKLTSGEVRLESQSWELPPLTGHHPTGSNHRVPVLSGWPRGQLCRCCSDSGHSAWQGGTSDDGGCLQHQGV